MERVTAEELRKAARSIKRLGVYEARYLIPLLTRAADTIDEMDKDIAILDNQDNPEDE